MDRWTVSFDWKKKDKISVWTHMVRKRHSDTACTCIQTSTNAKHHGIFAPLTTPFSSAAKKDLVIQYPGKHKQQIDCGGAYIKLLQGRNTFMATTFGGGTPYAFMFEPDICGHPNKKTIA